jgi:hypothetical protein
MKFLKLVILLWTVPLIAQQQLSVKDSLIEVLHHAESDVEKVKIYAKLATASSNAQALEFVQKGYDLARKIGYKKGQMECGIDLAFRSVHIDVFKAITLLLDAKQWSEKNKEILMRIRSLAFLGYAYNSLDFRKSIAYYKQAWQLMIQHKLDDDHFCLSMHQLATLTKMKAF